MRRITVRIVSTKRDGIVFKWSDPREGPKQRKATAKTQRKVAKEAAELEDDLNHRVSQVTWDDFVDRYTASYLDGMSKGHREKTAAMSRKVLAASVAKGAKTLYCTDVSARLILDVELAYRAEGVAESTVRSYMATLWAMLRWGMDSEFLPYFRRPRTRRGKDAKREKRRSRKSKGRSLTLEEIERMTSKLPSVCKPYEKPEGFIRAMQAARLIGLRLSDCWILNWEPIDGAHYPLNLNGRSPMIFFCDEQKSGEEQKIPLTPDAAVWLRSIQQESGWICRTMGARGEHKTPNRLGRVIADAGRAAGIVTKANGGKRGTAKYASIHDLRRTFATTWHQRLTISELQQLTRHADTQTLLDYYADAPVLHLASKLKQYADRVQNESGGFDGGDEFAADSADSSESLQNSV